MPTSRPCGTTRRRTTARARPFHERYPFLGSLSNITSYAGEFVDCCVPVRLRQRYIFLTSQHGCGKIGQEAVLVLGRLGWAGLGWAVWTMTMLHF
jgi:hypothetical protein